MDDICASTTNVPSSFRRICNIVRNNTINNAIAVRIITNTDSQISEAVHPRFPNAKYTAVGAFMFLRFFCPAIVAPEAEGLVSVAPTKEMRRGLLLIAKIIQNLANNILFGTKEPYMFPLNPFLVQNIHLVIGFLREVSVSKSSSFSLPGINE
jgi:neurofibromin 1